MLFQFEIFRSTQTSNFFPWACTTLVEINEYTISVRDVQITLELPTHFYLEEKTRIHYNKLRTADEDKFYVYAPNIFVFVNVSSRGLKEAFQK